MKPVTWWPSDLDARHVVTFWPCFICKTIVFLFFVHVFAFVVFNFGKIKENALDDFRLSPPPCGGRQTLKPVTWWPSDLEGAHVVAVRP